MSTPPLAPKLTGDVTVYLVLNDFGPPGRAYVETDEANASERDVVSNISNGQYSNPIEWWLSIPLRDGRVMSQRTSDKHC